MTRRTGYTSAPCHGCGASGLRPKDGVCQTCAGQLKAYANIVASQAESSERRVFVMKERSYALPYLQHEPRRFDASDPIRGPLHKLSMLLSEPSTTWVKSYADGVGYIDDAYLWSYGKNDSRSDWAVHRSMNPVVASVLRELQVAIRDGLKAAYADGAEQGRSLLMGLADGSITSDEFNDRAARQSGEKP